MIQGLNPRSIATPADLQGGKREQNKAQNRAAILKAALEVFIEIGYDAATVRDIVRRTSLASGTFYNYFTDKQAVFVELLNQHLAEIDQRVHRARKSAKTLREFVERPYREVLTYMASNPDAFAVARRNSGTIRSMLKDSIYGENLVVLREDILNAARQGILPAIDFDYLVSTMSGVGFEMAIGMVARDPVDVEGAVRFASDMVVGGIERIAARKRDE